MTVARKLEQARSAMTELRWDAAESFLDDCLAANSADWEAHDLLGDVAMARGDQRQAATHRARAVSANPADTALQKKFLNTAGGQKYRTYDADIEAAVAICLANDRIESLSGADPLWVWTLRQRPGFDALFQQASKPRLFPSSKNPLNACHDLSPLLDSYFQQGLRKILICWLQFEQFLTQLRAFVLAELFAAQPRLAAADRLGLVVSLAIYCFRTDYIFNITQPEKERLKRLQEIVAKGNADALALAVLACYQPLHKVTLSAADLERVRAAPALQPLYDDQIRAFTALQAEASHIERLLPIEDSTSLKVQAQYEDFPYPRWRHLEDFSNPTLPLEAALLTSSAKDVLVAGCGTGLQPCLLAQQYPLGRILALDISSASLAYAAMQARGLGFSQITFRQADILALDQLKDTFDYISCFGVLHHMADPELGWQKLVSRLRPEGLMEIGLYSRHARRIITTGRARIARLKVPPTPEGMRSFRRKSRWIFSPRDYLTLTNWYDYFSLNMYRDLLFHAHEDPFDIPRIERALATLGLTFAGFKLPESVLDQYRQRYPNDPDALNLKNWQAFEAAQPDTFSACYRFLCRKA